MLEILNQIGLSKPEIEVYKTILERGRNKSGEICKYAKVPSSKIYIILNELIQKGLVTFTTKNNVKYFEATPIESIKVLFEKKKEEFEKEKKELDTKEKEIIQIIENLKKIKSKDENRAKYNYYEGMMGIKAAWYKILDEILQNPDSSLKVHAPFSKESVRLFAFYSDFHKERIKKKVPYLAIMPPEYKEQIQKRKNYEFTQIKVKNIKNQSSWGVYGDLFFIQDTSSKEPFMIIINEPLVAKTFGIMFDEIWDSLLEFS
jgi:HTH-type transcriptional regulator, sugar sensing transcriptional regulator